MKIVKKYHVGDSGLVEGEAMGRITVYLAADFEQLVDAYAMVGNREHSLRTRIAELEQSEKLSQETVTLALRTGTRVAAERDALQELLSQRDEAIHDLEQRRHAEQQACQAAERRVEELERLLEEFATEMTLAITDSHVRSAMTSIGRTRFLQLLQAHNARVEVALNRTTEASSHE